MQFKNIKCERDHQKGVSCSFFTPCCFYSRRRERHHCRIFKRSQTTLGCSPAELLLHWCGCENTPHCLTAWSHLAERLFMGAIPASESFFSSVLSWSVCVDAKTHPHWHDFSIFWLIMNADTAAIQTLPVYFRVASSLLPWLLCLTCSCFSLTVT